MNDAPIIPDALGYFNVIIPSPTTSEVFIPYRDQPILIPGGSFAGAGPTHGQLLPIGTR